MSKLYPARHRPEEHETPVPPVEKRRHPRRPVMARAWIEDGNHTVYLRVHDLSAGGLSVRAPVAFAPAHSVDLRIELPGGCMVKARGEIIWMRQAPPDGGPKMGARFLQLLEGEQDLYALVGRT